MKPIRVIPIILTVYCFVSILPSQNVIASEAKQSEKPKTSAVIPACPESNRAIYYHPWLSNPQYGGLEYPYQPDMQGPLPPNQGTDDYEIIFNAVGPTDSSMLGKFLCLAGDQNGDGYDDILVYCEYPPETRLYFGGNPMDTIPDLVFSIPSNCAFFGPMPNELADLNGDGDVDIVIRYGYGNNYEEVFVYYGGEVLDTVPDVILASDEGSFTGYENFGHSISLGDINGDVYNDIAIGACNYDVNMMSGKLFLYIGGINFDSIPDFTITSGYNNLGDNFPGDVSICNDINNDGYNDIFCTSGWGSVGTAFLFLGNSLLDSIPDWIYEGGILGGALLEDINNDDYDDIALLWTSSFYYFRIYIFLGSDIIGNEPDYILQGPLDSSTKIRSAGDVNADGFNDIIAGDYGTSRVFIYYGGDNISTTPDITYYLPYQMFGYGYGDVGSAGDVNGDGIDDYMFFSRVDGNFLQGQMFIYGDSTLTPHVRPRNDINQPLSFVLYQNYPNPFNGVTVIPFQSNQTGDIKLYIYNILGQSVYFNSFDCTFGENIRVLWDGKDLSGNILPSGLYFAELIADEYRETIKMEIIR